MDVMQLMFGRMVHRLRLADLSLWCLLRDGTSQILLVAGRKGIICLTVVLFFDLRDLLLTWPIQATLILGLAKLNVPEYQIQSWQTTLLTMGIVAFCTLFNIFLAVRLPLVEALVLVLHVLGVFVVIIPLWIMAPRGNPHNTILNFTDNGGWGNLGLASTIGMIPMIGLLIVS